MRKEKWRFNGNDSFCPPGNLIVNITHNPKNIFQEQPRFQDTSHEYGGSTNDFPPSVKNVFSAAMHSLNTMQFPEISPMRGRQSAIIDVYMELAMPKTDRVYLCDRTRP